MLKLLFTALLVYLAYRLFFQKPAIPGAGIKDELENRNARQGSDSVNGEDGEEYIDYEEVDDHN
ncbi:MAG: hypothetical protein R3350_04675 [Saprospiraceae bacterium]|nr:hypothetical protein [Saprospiraceae bacterium]